MELSITENAIKRFKANLSNNPDAKGLRISIKPTGCNGYSYVLDYASDISNDDQVMTFSTNVEDVVVAGAENPIRVVRDAGGEPSPYIHIRAGLEALIDRKTFYRMIDLGQAHVVDGVNMFGVWSSGQFFPIIPVAELEG